jgi:ATP-dependent helicase HrpA
LKAQLGEAAQLTFSETTTGIEREGIKVWDFGDLPPTITFNRGGRQVTGYPALADEGDSVAIRLFDVESAAQESMRAGIVRLMRLMLKLRLMVRLTPSSKPLRLLLKLLVTSGSRQTLTTLYGAGMALYGCWQRIPVLPPV